MYYSSWSLTLLLKHSGVQTLTLPTGGETDLSSCGSDTNRHENSVRVRGPVVKAHLSCPQHVFELSETPSFNRLFISLSLFPSSLLNILHIFCCLCGIPACICQLSIADEINHSAAAQDYRQHSRQLGRNVNSALPNGYLGLLDCLCVSVFLG